jgi:hypothetical protein
MYLIGLVSLVSATRRATRHRVHGNVERETKERGNGKKLQVAENGFIVSLLLYALQETGSTRRSYLKEKVASPVYKVENTAVGIRCPAHATLPTSKSWY